MKQLSRRSILAGAGALAIGKALPAQVPPKPKMPVLSAADTQVFQVQQSMLANVYQGVKSGYPNPWAVQSAITWSEQFRMYSLNSGWTAYLDYMLSFGDPLHLYGSLAPWNAVYNVYSGLQGLGVNIPYYEVAAMFSSNFWEGAIANWYLGGVNNMYQYFDNQVLPMLYQPLYPYAAGNPESSLVDPAAGDPAAYVNCGGVKFADNILSTVMLGLGIATAFGCVICPIVAVSHALPLIVVKIISLTYCRGNAA